MGRFPNQKLTRAQKIKEHGSEQKWAEEIFSSLETLNEFSSSNNIEEDYEIASNYELVEGRFNKDDFENVIKRFGSDGYEMPSDLEHYDIISPKYDLIRGEEIKRPFNFKVIRTNPEAVSEAKAAKDEMVKEMFQGIASEMAMKMGLTEQDETGAPVEYPKSFKEIEKFMEKDYRDVIEQMSDEALNYLHHYLDLPDVFNKGFEHHLKSGKEVYWVGTINGNPSIRAVDSRYAKWDKSLGEDKVHKSAWFMEWRYLTAADVHDEFYDRLDEDDVDKIEDLKGQYIKSPKDGFIASRVTHGDAHSIQSGSYSGTNDTIVKVTRLEWKSLRKVGKVTWYDESGELQSKIIDEEYKLNKEIGEEVEWVWVTERWEIDQIGNELYTEARPVPNQFRDLENISENPLSYVGRESNYCFISKMRPWQMLYNVFFYHLKLEFASAMGKVGIFDVAQIPRSEGFDLDKWLYYLKTMRIGFVNSMEEGKGAFAGQKPSFNQFSQMDLSVANSINHYVGILDFIERKIGDISGITKQREGQVSASETLGGVEKSILQSSHITEYLFEYHNRTKRDVLERLLDEAKFAWREGKKAQYVVSGTLNKVYFDIEPEAFSNESFGIFVSNSAKDNAALEAVKQLAQTALQNQQISMKELIEIMTSNNLSKTKDIMEEGQKRMEQQQQQAAQQADKTAKEVEQMRQQFEERKIQSEEGMNTQDNETKLQIAGMSMDTKKYDVDRNGIPDEFELGMKQQEIDIKQRKQESDEEFQKRKLELEQEKIEVSKRKTTE